MGTHLRNGPSESGFSVDLERDGAFGFGMARSGNYDAIVLDVMLPGMCGVEFVKRLRQIGMQVPVLMLTVRHTVEGRIKGLESGADDYLAKHYVCSELLARVPALLRRSPMQDATRFSLPDLQLDQTTRRTHRGSRWLDLTAKEFALLSLLLRRQGQIMSSVVLADQVWGMSFDSETNVIEVAVRRLKAKLLVSIVGFLLVRRSLAPLKLLAAETAKVGPDKPGRRIVASA